MLRLHPLYKETPLFSGQPWSVGGWGGGGPPGDPAGADPVPERADGEVTPGRVWGPPTDAEVLPLSHPVPVPWGLRGGEACHKG